MKWLIIIALLLLIFGATRLPHVGHSLGQAWRALREEMKLSKK